MKKAVIWDLDGTLLDSYDVIVESLYQTFHEVGIVMSREQIHQHTIQFSTKYLFQKVEVLSGIPAEQLQQRYSQISAEKYLQIKVMEHAKDILTALEKKSVESYVFTHRGRTTVPVLDNLKMTGCFKEILTSRSGFARKPNPDAIQYLVNRYHLDPSHTYYVGDRRLDMECAKNAGIMAILYLPPGSIDVSGGGEDYIVKDLLEIEKIV